MVDQVRACTLHLDEAQWQRLQALGGPQWLIRQLTVKPTRPLEQSGVANIDAAHFRRLVEEKRKVVYTHSTALRGVFYIGAGDPIRARNFAARSAAHKAIVAQLGRENVIVRLVWVSRPGAPLDFANTMLYKERLIIAKHLSNGADLCNGLNSSLLRLSNAFIATRTTRKTSTILDIETAAYGKSIA